MDYNQLKATKSILVQAPIAAGSTVCKGSAAVDCANFESCLFSHIIGTMGSTCAVVAKIQDSTSTTAWTDLSGATQSSTAALKIAGTAISASAAELNVGEGVTAGTVAAGKAVVVDTNKDVTGLRNVTLTGYQAGPVQAVTATTTGYSAVISNAGISTIGTTSARKLVHYKIAAPVAGITKHIAAITTGSTGALGWITPATTATLSTTGMRKISVAGKNDFVTLAGLSASQYTVVAKSTGVTLGNT